jgi:hypothetical protein
VFDDVLDDDLPSIEVATLHLCDWDTTRAFFETPSFTKLRELRVAFPAFDSDPMFDLAYYDAHLSDVPLSELTPAASCCVSLSEAVSGVSRFICYRFLRVPTSVVRDATTKDFLHHWPS